MLVVDGERIGVRVDDVVAEGGHGVLIDLLDEQLFHCEVLSGEALERRRVAPAANLGECLPVQRRQVTSESRPISI